MSAGKRIIKTLLAAGLFILIGFVWPTNRDREMSGVNPMDGKLTVHFIDVEDGESALLMCAGEAMLIDAGSAQDAEIITAYLDEQKIRSLKCIVATHNHVDNIGGIPAVLESCDVETLYISPVNNESEEYLAMIAAAENKGCELVITDTPPNISFTLGQAQVDFIGPYGTFMNMDEASLVLKATYGEASFLFTGDMGRYSATELMDYRIMPSDITVLKVAAHGDNDSTRADLLLQLDPIYAVVCCKEGQASDELLLRLDQHSSYTYRTDWHGSIKFETDGASMEVTVQNEAPTKTHAELAAAEQKGKE